MLVVFTPLPCYHFFLLSFTFRMLPIRYAAAGLASTGMEAQELLTTTTFVYIVMQAKCETMVLTYYNY